MQASPATLVSLAPLDCPAQLASKASRDDLASLDGLVQEVGQVELVPWDHLDYPVLLEIQVNIHSGYISS